MLVFEERRQVPTGDVTILVDCCGKDRSTVFPVPCRIISSAPKEGDSVRCNAYNHLLASCCRREFDNLRALINYN